MIEDGGGLTIENVWGSQIQPSSGYQSLLLIQKLSCFHSATVSKSTMSDTFTTMCICAFI